MNDRERYLGDGLYASFDGYMVTLTAPRQNGATHWVGLEPTVFSALIRFARDVGMSTAPER
jgi:hypothetical protein